MVDGATFDEPLARAGLVLGGAAGVTVASSVTVTTTRHLADVEAIWRGFSFAGIESPGQSYDFIRLWIEALEIPLDDQLYVVAALDGQPVALLPLYRRRRVGISLYGWFPGTHVGCNAPLVDAGRLATLSAVERQRFWRDVVRRIGGADLIYLPAIPERIAGIDGLFAGLGRSLPVETLYRSAFSSWNDANTTQRSKSRRKHDRQQGERLEALGQVSFEVVERGPEASTVLDVMFRQRARRFEAMGVKDPFVACDIARFYQSTVLPTSPLDVKLHVLRLNGDIVAVRYNVVHGDRLYCLISSMSDDAAIQVGSPGKQCLLRVMQSVFDEGFRVFDMGAGFTDEKRHWCNDRTTLANHYVPLSLKGRVVIEADAAWRAVKARVKANPALLRLVKTARARVHWRGAADQTPADAPALE